MKGKDMASQKQLGQNGWIKAHVWAYYGVKNFRADNPEVHIVAWNEGHDGKRYFTDVTCLIPPWVEALKGDLQHRCFLQAQWRSRYRLDIYGYIIEGPFDGERIYAPFLHAQRRKGHKVSDGDDVVVLLVLTKKHKWLFPELRGSYAVSIFETANGEVLVRPITKEVYRYRCRYAGA
jgi:hypothetical protein